MTKELVVLSGKGGTGKTSLVASFAALAGGIVLADCDVDAADLHLVMRPKIVRRVDFIAGKTALVKADMCVGCGKCEEVCAFGAVGPRDPIERAAGGPVFQVDPLACEGCGVCAHFCPTGAMSLEDAHCGEWYLSHTPFGPMVHAKLRAGAENSGKLATLVRNKARVLADADQSSLLLIDGPPGIGCPVIASIAGAHAVLVVSEPTLSGLHDLERICELTRHFGIPTSLCINRFDINPEVADRIEARAVELGVGFAGRIPCDPAFVEAQLAGVSVVEHGNGRVRAQIERVWQFFRKGAGVTLENSDRHADALSET